MPRPRRKAYDSSSESMSASEDEENPMDGWVCCDRCSKWRRVPHSVTLTLSEDAPWYCELNPLKVWADCSVPPEMSQQEIEAMEVVKEDEGDDNDAEDGVDVELSEERLRRKRTPAVWQLIGDNQYIYRRRKALEEDDISICNCKPISRGGDGCGPNCLNRILCLECVPNYCPSGHHCTNQVFTRKQYASLEVRRAGAKGFGLFALEPIKAGQFVIEYIGEVLEEREYQRRKTFYSLVGQRHYYFMNIGNGEYIDACRMGNRARFINHSCDPNCETQKWNARGELAIGLYSIKDIAAGEELTFDYNFERYGDKPTRCYCKARTCRGFIGGKSKRIDATLICDPEDVTNDWQPIMLTDRDMDKPLQYLLDWRVGPWDFRDPNVAVAKEKAALRRLEKLCHSRGVGWKAGHYFGSLAAPKQDENEVVAEPSRRDARRRVEDGARRSSRRRDVEEPTDDQGDHRHHRTRTHRLHKSTGPETDHDNEITRQQQGTRRSSRAAAKAAAKAAADEAEDAAAAGGVASGGGNDLDLAAMLAGMAVQSLTAGSMFGMDGNMDMAAMMGMDGVKTEGVKVEGNPFADPFSAFSQPIKSEPGAGVMKTEAGQQQPTQRKSRVMRRTIIKFDGAKPTEEQLQQLQQQLLEKQMQEKRQQQQKQAAVKKELGQEQGTEDESEIDSEDYSGSELGSDDDAGASQTPSESEPSIIAGPDAAALAGATRVPTRRRSAAHAMLAAAAAAAAAATATGDDKKVDSQSSALTGLLGDTADSYLGIAGTALPAFWQLSDIKSTKGAKAGPSEISRRLDDLVGPSGRLKDASRYNIVQVLRMFNLCDMSPRVDAKLQPCEGPDAAATATSGATAMNDNTTSNSQRSGPEKDILGPMDPAYGTTRVPSPAVPVPKPVQRDTRAAQQDQEVTPRQRSRMADVSALLDVILKTTSSTVKREFITCGVLNQLQQCIGRNFGQHFTVILRKILRVLEALPILADDLYGTRTGHGTFADTLRELATHGHDNDARNKAIALLRKHPATTCKDPVILQRLQEKGGLFILMPGTNKSAGETAKQGGGGYSGAAVVSATAATASKIQLHPPGVIPSLGIMTPAATVPAAGAAPQPPEPEDEDMQIESSEEEDVHRQTKVAEGNDVPDLPPMPAEDDATATAAAAGRDGSAQPSHGVNAGVVSSQLGHDKESTLQVDDTGATQSQQAGQDHDRIPPAPGEPLPAEEMFAVMFVPSMHSQRQRVAVQGHVYGKPAAAVPMSAVPRGCIHGTPTSIEQVFALGVYDTDWTTAALALLDRQKQQAAIRKQLVSLKRTEPTSSPDMHETNAKDQQSRGWDVVKRANNLVTAESNGNTAGNSMQDMDLDNKARAHQRANGDVPSGSVYQQRHSKNQKDVECDIEDRVLPLSPIRYDICYSPVRQEWIAAAQEVIHARLEAEVMRNLTTPSPPPGTSIPQSGSATPAALPSSSVKPTAVSMPRSFGSARNQLHHQQQQVQTVPRSGSHPPLPTPSPPPAVPTTHQTQPLHAGNAAAAALPPAGFSMHVSPVLAPPALHPPLPHTSETPPGGVNHGVLHQQHPHQYPQHSTTAPPMLSAMPGVPIAHQPPHVKSPGSIPTHQPVLPPATAAGYGARGLPVYPAAPGFAQHAGPGGLTYPIQSQHPVQTAFAAQPPSAHTPAAMQPQSSIPVHASHAYSAVQGYPPPAPPTAVPTAALPPPVAQVHHGFNSSAPAVHVQPTPMSVNPPPHVSSHIQQQQHPYTQPGHTHAMHAAGSSVGMYRGTPQQMSTTPSTAAPAAAPHHLQPTAPQPANMAATGSAATTGAHGQAAATQGAAPGNAAAAPPPPSDLPMVYVDPEFMHWSKHMDPGWSDTWEGPDDNFSAFVKDAVRYRLGKYVVAAQQAKPPPPPPLDRFSCKEADSFYTKICNDILGAEKHAFNERTKLDQFKLIERHKVEFNIREYVRQKVKRWSTTVMQQS